MSLLSPEQTGAANPEPRYDLTSAEQHEAASQYLWEHPVESGDRFIAVTVGAHDPLANAGRTIEREVFESAFGNDTDTMKAEYGTYEDDSIFFVVLDREEVKPVGVMRVIEDRGNGVKSLNEAPEFIGGSVDKIKSAHGMDDGGKLWDIGTLAVLPEYRGRKSALEVSSLLYRALTVNGKAAGVEHAVAMIDKRAYRNLDLLGVPFVPMNGSEPFDYLGSEENRALYGHFPDFESSVGAKSVELREKARMKMGDILCPRIKEKVYRRVASKIAHSLSTGDGLDDRIILGP